MYINKQNKNPSITFPETAHQKLPKKHQKLPKILNNPKILRIITHYYYFLSCTMWLTEVRIQISFDFFLILNWKTFSTLELKVFF